MNNIGNLFDKETVENISKLVQDKMQILNNVTEFKEKDQSFASALENLEDRLSDELNDQFDDIMRLNYQIESYYFTLAYFLGLQHGNQVAKL